MAAGARGRMFKDVEYVPAHRSIEFETSRSADKPLILMTRYSSRVRHVFTKQSHCLIRYSMFIRVVSEIN